MKRSINKVRSIYPVLVFLACVLMVFAIGCTSKQPSGNKIDDWEEEITTTNNPTIKNCGTLFW